MLLTLFKYVFYFVIIALAWAFTYMFFTGILKIMAYIILFAIAMVFYIFCYLLFLILDFVTIVISKLTGYRYYGFNRNKEETKNILLNIPRKIKAKFIDIKSDIVKVER